MLPQPCPWSAAADASEEHAKRAWGQAHDTRYLATIIDPRNDGTIKATQALARVEESNAEALEWARDFFRFASQHAAAFNRFRVLLEAGQPIDHAMRTAIRETRTTSAVGGAAVNVIELARARKP